MRQQTGHGWAESRGIPIEASPTGTVPSLWWMAHWIKEEASCEVRECSERETDVEAVRMMSVIVLTASFEYA